MNRILPNAALAWLLLAALLLAPSPGHAQRIDDSITAHYPFENSLDEAAGVDTRPVVRGSLGYAPGALGRAAELSGDDEIDFVGIPAATFSGNFSLAWFMNLESAGAHPLLGKEAGCSNADRFLASVANGDPARLEFRLGNSSADIAATASVPRRQWVHVALVREGSQATVWVDGRPGRSVTLPTLNLAGISAPLAMSSSPCLGRIIGLSRPAGRFDELRIYPRALDAATIEGLARRPSFTASPARVSPGGSFTVRASHLVVGRTYEIRLAGSRNTSLFRGPATAASMSWPLTLPELASGQYPLQLVAILLRGIENVERSVPVTVSPRLGITASPSAQAGKRASFVIDQLQPGGLVRLFYAGRLLAGPEPAAGTTHRFSVILPSDFPTGLPASVALRAEQLQGRSVSHIGTASVSVAAPFSGRFAPLQQLSSDRTLVPPDEKVRVSGRFAFADGASAANTEVSAFWMGDDGSVTPLPTSALAVAADGTLRLDTRPPSLAAMSAVRPQSGGRLRLVMKRDNELGRAQWEIQEGPRLETFLDTDPDTDITVRVMRRGTQSSDPLPGAYVVMSSAAPLGYMVDPPGGSNGESGADTGGGSFYQPRQPSLRRIGAESKALMSRPAAVNQLDNQIADLPPPPAPACGEDLYRRYTDSQGKAEFPVLGGPEESPASWQSMQSLMYTASECTGVGCAGVQFRRIYSFRLAVYTLHLGAGFRHPNTRAEVPTQFDIQYDRDNETFTIKNLRSGETTVQQVSANLLVEVPLLTGSDNFVSFDDPLMYHEIGGQPINLVNRHQGGFGRWIDFSDTRVAEFANPSPDKVLQFGHRPDVNGSITSAKLYLTGINGNVTSIGDFQQVSLVDGCNLQDNPANNRTETWRLKLRPEFANAWRFPRGVFFANGAPRKACGYIEARNASGGSGRNNLCFHWREAPGFMYGAGGPITVNDADMFDVLVEESGNALGAATTTVPKRQADLLGEPIDKPGRIDNSTQANNGVYASIGPDGPTGGSRRLTGNNPKQFSEGAAGEQSLLNVANGASSVPFGDDEYQTILDTTIPLFQWYWGVPEILSAEVFARLRLVAKYFFGGTITTVNGRERLDMLTNAAFFTFISVGVDIDVLFGLIVDAGASLTGLILSEMPVVVEDGVSQDVEPCITFQLDFSYYVDPCTLCPTPAITGEENILRERVPSGCGFYSAGKGAGTPAADPELAALAREGAKGIRFGFAEARQLRRHPALAFDVQGSGQLVMLDDAGALTANPLGEVGLAAPTTLSAAMGLRDPEIAYFDVDRAIAVWSENALPEASFRIASYPILARNQRLAWAEWDGERWSDKRFLTEAGPGEGQLDLVACPAGEAGCPAGGEVLAVWQRDANSNALNPRYRLWHAQFRPASGFTAPASIDPTPTASVQDITPAAAYVGGRAVVVWTRQFGGSLNDFSQRNLAYRVLPDGAPISLGAAPGANAPSVAAKGSSGLRVAWLRADPNTSANPNATSAGAVGTQQALYVTQAVCNATTCSFPTSLVPATRDQHGRRIYGERPRLIRGEEDVLVVMRAFRLEGDTVEQVQPGDPIGTVINSADVVAVSPNYATGIARVTALTADGLTHAGVFGAYNPATRSIVSGSAVFAPPRSAPFRDALKATGFDGHRAYAKRIAGSGPIELRASLDAPDLALEQMLNLASLAPSTAQTTRITVGNRGTGYDPARDGAVQIELRWNSPGGALLASAPLPAISAGGELAVELRWTAPASAHPDEAAALHALVVPPQGFDEVTADNNLLQLDYPGMPVPEHLASNAVPGVPQVQLGWDPLDDPRVAGYRVYRQEAGGDWTPMGASPAHGFLDLSASFFAPRTYAVSSYSSRGIESALSAPITVMPVTAGAALMPFSDGFEGDG